MNITSPYSSTIARTDSKIGAPIEAFEPPPVRILIVLEDSGEDEDEDDSVLAEGALVLSTYDVSNGVLDVSNGVPDASNGVLDVSDGALDVIVVVMVVSWHSFSLHVTVTISVVSKAGESDVVTVSGQ